MYEQMNLKIYRFAFTNKNLRKLSRIISIFGTRREREDWHLIIWYRWKNSKYFNLQKINKHSQVIRMQKNTSNSHYRIDDACSKFKYKKAKKKYIIKFTNSVNVKWIAADTYIFAWESVIIFSWVILKAFELEL